MILYTPDDPAELSIMPCALLVIDMLNEYLLPHGKIFCRECTSIIPRISDTINWARAHHIPIVYINSALTPQSVLVKKWGEHAMRGSAMAQVIDELAPEADDWIIEKQGYDGFFETSLAPKLRTQGITTVALTGIHTHVCVLATAIGAFENGFTVITLSDCITTSYRPNHDTRLRFFSSHVGSLLTSCEWRANFESTAH